MASDMILPYWISISLRLFCMNLEFLTTDRPEVSTPLNSYHRLVEGISLFRSKENGGAGIDPYSGALFHETPLALALFDFVSKKWPHRVPSLFVIGDIITAFILGKLARAVGERMFKVQAKNKAKYHEDAKDIIIEGEKETEEYICQMEKYTQYAFLFNPFIIANCSAKTTTVFANLLLAVCLWCIVKRRTFLGAIVITLAAYQGLYPIMLLSPLCLSGTDVSTWSLRNWKSKFLSQIFPVLFAAGLTITGLVYGSLIITKGEWTFIDSIYGFILMVPELTPNSGLFWYFFTEMFEHFRLFFIATFQLNVFIYLVPLSVKLRNEPYLLAYLLIALTAIFKSYPCYGDVGFYVSLLPTLRPLLPYFRHGFYVAVAFIATTALGPLVYRLWIYNGSANANYYFAINCVYAIAQIFLVTDLLFAHAKRDFFIFNGFKSLKPEDEKSGKREARLVLQ